jgi:hypothetical protein
MPRSKTKSIRLMQHRRVPAEWPVALVADSPMYYVAAANYSLVAIVQPALSPPLPYKRSLDSTIRLEIFQ